ncbi:uncharacterized protein LOC143182062 [Calliopsis andreniformis]|uniref:uncharacterized protein LOC143182062 n=1 Tax=Calliopsis andreniformis TaxID=337506 RepID=UPI003FCD78E7
MNWIARWLPSKRSSTAFVKSNTISYPSSISFGPGLDLPRCLLATTDFLLSATSGFLTLYQRTSVDGAVEGMNDWSMRVIEMDSVRVSYVCVHECIDTHEFSDVSILCDSKIELPWKEIALSPTGMRIRQEVSLTPLADQDEQAGDETVGKAATEEESNGTMLLPWKDLVITETVPSKLADPETCDSTLEIPWNDLVLEKPMEIRAPEEEACATDDVEIPWNEIMVPRNIVIEPQKKKKHPSSQYPPRMSPGMSCTKCKRCCADSAGRGMRSTASCK